MLLRSLPGPRRRPPTQHRAACYSSVCPQGAWTPGHKPRLTLGQSCLLLSGAGMSLAASVCLHHSSACKETRTSPSTCDRKENRSGSRRVPLSAGSLHQQVFICCTKDRQQWPGSFSVQSWKAEHLSLPQSSLKTAQRMKAEKRAHFSLIYLSQGSLGPELLF